MIGLQDHLNVCAVSQCNMLSSRNSFKVNSFEMIHLTNQPLEKINCAFDKISLLLQTVFESEARNFLPTFKLDLSWALKMSDQQNDWFARPCDTLKCSMGTICIT